MSLEAKNREDGNGIDVGEYHLNQQMCYNILACRDIGRVLLMISQGLHIRMDEARKIASALGAKDLYLGS